MTVPSVCAQCGKLAFDGDTVTIPTSEYQELALLREAREAAFATVSKIRLRSRSKITRDPELARFIIRCAETMLIREIASACVEKFGPERAPSKSSIHRFIHEVAPRS